MLAVITITQHENVLENMQTATTKQACQEEHMQLLAAACQAYNPLLVLSELSDSDEDHTTQGQPGSACKVQDQTLRAHLLRRALLSLGQCLQVVE
jgi:hypothetical protein